MDRNILRKKTVLLTGIAAVIFCTISLPLAARNDTIVPVDKDPEELLRNIDLKDFAQHGFNFWYDDFAGSWAGIDLGFNTFIHADYSGYSQAFMKPDLLRSNSACINLIQQSIGLQRNRNTIGLVTGIGLQLQSYRLERNTTLRETEDGRIEPETLIFDQNQKSKLSIVSLTVPLLAEFQFPVQNYQDRIHLSAGLYGGLRLGSHTKIKYRLDGKKEKLKTPGSYSLRDFKYGVMARAGYRRVNVFAAYELVPLFQKSKGPVLTPFTFGITLIKF